MFLMPTPKKAGRPRKHPEADDTTGRTGVALGIRIDPELRAKVNEFIAAFRRKHDVRLDLTTTVELALTKLFREWELLPKESDAK